MFCARRIRFPNSASAVGVTINAIILTCKKINRQSCWQLQISSNQLSDVIKVTSRSYHVLRQCRHRGRRSRAVNLWVSHEESQQGTSVYRLLSIYSAQTSISVNGKEQRVTMPYSNSCLVWLIRSIPKKENTVCLDHGFGSNFRKCFGYQNMKEA